jgi:beta-galactosidase
MILATQYYRPPFPDRRYFEEDLKAIKNSGFNAIQLWALWGWVEPEPGVFRFDDFDELFDIAHKNGLGVVLSTIAEIQPYWIHRVIPDSFMIDHMGNKVISSNREECNQGLTPGGCTDNPEVLKHMENYLLQIGQRYVNRPNLVGYDCWNELRWNVQSDNLVCFCPHTLKAFREWLKSKYGSLEGLNEAWKRRYSSFEDVMPGKLPDRPYTEMMEFEAFLQWRAAEHVKFRYDILRKVDPERIITTHGPHPSMVMVGDSKNHAINRGNDFDLSDYVDGLGCSHFPLTPWADDDDNEYGVRIEATRSGAQKKPFWISELQGGSARVGFQVFPPVRADQQQRWIWNGLMRGAKAIIIWCWRDEIFGRESSGFGFAGMDGYYEERAEAMRETEKFIVENQALLESYRPDEPAAGIYFDPNTYNLEWAQDGYAKRAYQSIKGYALAFEHAKIPYSLVESSHLEALNDLKLLVMPMPLIVPEKAAEAIVQWVKNGGTLIVEGDADAYTTTGFYRYPDTDRSFTTQLGINYIGRRQMDCNEVDLKIGTGVYRMKTKHSQLSTFETPLAVTPDTRNNGEVEVFYSVDNLPMAIRQKVGKGTVIALSYWAGLAYSEDGQNGKGKSGFVDFVDYVAETYKAGSKIKIQPYDQIQWRSGKSGETRLLMILNSGEVRKVTVTVPSEMLNGSGKVTDLHQGKSISVRQMADGISEFEIDLPGKKCMVLSI